MKYYYLDDARNICGPYTKEQMCSMVLNGTIQADTFCAAEGEKEWRPISEHNWMKQPNSVSVIPPPPSYGKMGSCVRCGAEQEGINLLPSCSSCGAAQAPVNSSMWSFFCLALRRLLSFRGRSQRKEYWSFCLFGGLILLLLPVMSTVLNLFSLFYSGTFPTCGIQFFVVGGILLTYPLLARRLHDIGLSGWWVILPFVITVYSQSYMAYELMSWSDIPVERKVSNTDEVMSMEELRKKHPEIKLPEGEGEVRVVSRREIRSARYRSAEGEAAKERLTDSLGIYRVLTWVNAVVAMLNNLIIVGIIIVGCIDSQRGANKYGPSSKYPHA